jgi:hypothetical protein
MVLGSDDISCWSTPCCAAITAAPAFFAPLHPAFGAFIAKYGLEVLLFILTVIITWLITDEYHRRTLEEMEDQHGPEECLAFFAFLEDFCKAWDINWTNIRNDGDIVIFIPSSWMCLLSFCNHFSEHLLLYSWLCSVCFQKGSLFH